MYGFFEPVPQPAPEPRPQRQAGADRKHDPHPRQDGQAAWNLRLSSAGTNVAVCFLAESPSVAVLAVEDLCWQAATEDWKHRRPHRWRLRACSAWRAEGSVLTAKADRLRQMADDVLQEL